MYQIGWTPLIRAARNGRLSVVEYLVEKGADIEATDNVSDVISLMRNHTYVMHEYTCECVRMDTLHCYLLHGMVI